MVDVVRRTFLTATLVFPRGGGLKPFRSIGSRIGNVEYLNGILKSTIDPTKGYSESDDGIRSTSPGSP